MNILATSNSHGSKHVEFLQDYLLSGYIQTHGLKGIPKISNPKTSCYFMNNTILNQIPTQIAN